MTDIELQCGRCGRFFVKKRNEYNRRIRKGSTKFYCSRTCAGKVNKENMRQWLDAPGKTENLDAGNRKDDYSAFRFFLRKVRARNKKKGWKTDLTLPFLKELWESQNGICPLSGWKMTLPETTKAWDEMPPTPQRASLDRIIPMEPYSMSNVRFVSYMGNLCRHTFDDDEVRLFAESVMKYVSKTKNRNG